MPSDGIPTFSTAVALWTRALRDYLLALAAAAAADQAANGGTTKNPVPAILVLATDQQCTVDCLVYPDRERLYVLKDSFGKVWNPIYPVQINELFTRLSGDYIPAPNGVWSTNDPRNDYGFIQEKGVLDSYGPSPTAGTAVYLQRYIASSFNSPGKLFPLPPTAANFGIPALSVPLLIESNYNPASGKSACTYYTAQLIKLIGTNVPSINGDSGWPLHPANPICK